LASTRYKKRTDTKFRKIETHFKEWQIVAGSAYPIRIERYEDGNLIFVFIVSEISTEPGDLELES